MTTIDLQAHPDSAYFNFTGARSSQISFPLGGIGTGCIGLAGNGRLIDWEIYNRPNKLSRNGYSFFAVKAESSDGKLKLAKVLHGDLQPPYTGEGLGKYRGFGYGPQREDITGIPHFARTTFTGQFPFAQIDYDDIGDPIQIKMTAYNPFIPLNDKDSSLPCAIFEFEVHNRSDEALEISLAGMLGNPHNKRAVNRKTETNGLHAIQLTSLAYEAGDPSFGELTLATDQRHVSYQTYLYRGSWFDNLTVLWKDFKAPGGFRDRQYSEPREINAKHLTRQDGAVLCGHQTIAAGERRTFKFVITWHYPNFMNYWNPGPGGLEQAPVWPNYYATLFANSLETTKYVFREYDRLLNETSAFHRTLYHSSLPDYVLDAVASNISILKSPTVLRLTDGTLYGFEGSHTNEGSCEGTTSHVWNYEQATAFLFPALARSMRTLDYKYNQFENGKLAFRVFLPPERTTKENHRVPAADGQMGGIIRSYREWKLSGDTDWLRSIWPNLRKALEYAWNPTNENRWDPNKNGVMEGRQHHTLDTELFGPNSWITSMYLTALKAATEMAEALGEPDTAAEYRSIFERGAAWTNDNLFNGEYFHQSIDLKDSSIIEGLGVSSHEYWNEEAGELKYQVDNGCGIDQVLGQWFAHLTGLGYVLDADKVKSSLRAIYRYNFIDCLREYPNACRVYALNDESGLLICTWPKDDSPVIPLTYADECMHGFEYQAASHMIYEGYIEEGLRVAKSVRERYDGEKRNPWNEIECGSNYVRSMASYGLLLALSGFEYDMTKGHVGFNPKMMQDDYRTFWSLNDGWGSFRHQPGSMTLEVQWGQVKLRSFASDLLTDRDIMDVQAAGRSIPFARDGRTITLQDEVTINKMDKLEIRYRQ